MISPDLTTQNKTFNLCDEAATSDLAKRLAGVISAPCLLYLEGDLGAGKTFFVRSLLQSLGFSGKVKSPTYTLMEPYQIDPLIITISTYTVLPIRKNWNYSAHGMC